MSRYIIAFLVVGFCVSCEKNHDQVNHEPLANLKLPTALLPKIPEATGSEEDPGERFEYELLRYRDPATGKIPTGIRSKEISYAQSLPLSKGYSLTSVTGKTFALNLNFTASGPYNVGGRSRAIAIDRNNSDILLAGGVSGGLWRSADQGNNWQRVSGIDELPNIRSIVQDPRAGKESIWYYGTGEIEPGNSAATPGAPYRGNGIFTSTNNGITWSAVQTTDGIENLTSPLNYVHNLAIDPSNPSGTEMYAACIGGILRSTDGFQSFDLVLGTENIASDANWTEVAVTSAGVVYATVSSSSTSEQGIFRSTTGITGSWENITPDEGYDGTFRRTVIGISPSNEDIVYFLGNKGPDQGNSLHRYNATAQEGSQWSNRSEFIPAGNDSIAEYDAQGSYNMLVAVHPEDENIVFIGGTNLYRSTNGFSDATKTQWIGGYTRNSGSSNYYNHHPDQHSVVFFPENPDKMLSSHDGGLSITDNDRKSSVTEVQENGSTVQTVTVVWQPLNNGYITSQFYSVAMDGQNVGDPSLLGGLQDNSTYLSQDVVRTNDWLNIGAGDGSYCYYDLESIILSAQFSNLYRFAVIDGSFELFTISTPNAGDDTENLFINPFLLDPVSPNKMFVGGRGKIYYTLDVRRNPTEEEWEEFGTGTLPPQARVSALGASVEPQSVLYVATEDGHVYKIPNSTRLNSISDITASNFPSSGYPSSIVVDPSDADRVLISFSNYNVESIFYTTDGGESWNRVGGNLENSGVTTVGAPSVRWLSILPNGTNPVYLAGTSVGLFSTETLDGASTVWSREGASTIGTVPVDMISVRPIDGRIAIATHGNGIYEATANVPFHADLQLLDIRCEAGEFALQSNLQISGSEDEYDLNYEWFINGESQGASLNSPVVTSSDAATFQVRVTNTITGDSDLSNEVEVSFGGVSITWCNDAVTAVEPDNEEVSVYPNPTTGPVMLRFPQGKFERALVYRMNGQVIYDQMLEGNGWEFTLKDYPAGLYVLKLLEKDKRITKKIIKIQQ